MNLINLLLMTGFLSFLAPYQGPFPGPTNENGPLGPIIDLARLAKGRVLVCSIKEGMNIEEVTRILGTCSMWSMDIGHNDSFWEAYGIWVDFTPPFFLNGFDVEKYDPRVISVHWYLPPKYRWNSSWMFGKASHQKKQKLCSPSSSSDATKRMHELLNNSEDVRKDEEEWKRMWFMDGSSGAGRVHRVHGGIQ